MIRIRPWMPLAAVLLLTGVGIAVTGAMRAAHRFLPPVVAVLVPNLLLLLIFIAIVGAVVIAARGRGGR